MLGMVFRGEGKFGVLHAHHGICQRERVHAPGQAYRVVVVSVVLTKASLNY